ncbi:membrane protein insertase YidC [Altererythrobacter sp. CAU 1778]
MDNQRNLLIAVVLSLGLILGWDLMMNRFYPQPEEPVVAEAPAATVDGAPLTAAEREAAARPRRSRESGLFDPEDIAAEERDLATNLAAPDRVALESPKLAGSINPVGARIDDVTLTDHRQSIDKDSGPVRLFSPSGTPAQYFAQFGWVGDGVRTPPMDAAWQVSGERLTPSTPVTLSWNNGAGQLFQTVFTMDENYIVTAEQSVSNTSANAIALQPFASLNRTSITASPSTWNMHSGPIGAFDGAVDFDYDYDDVAEAREVSPEGTADWLGFTDTYWLSALIPQDGSRAQADFRSLGNDIYRADLIYDTVTVPAGKKFTRTTSLFTGAKESSVLSAYEDSGLANFSRTIDWGWFEIIEKPILWLLKQLFALVGNFGVAIMLLTLIIRTILFPIAQKQFKSFAGMRAVQPKVKALQERYKDDKPKLQQKMMELYKTEKVNPLAGCLPTLLQIPIFFALYKVLMLSIEMRHQPFVLWIKDLSAPDPATVLNLFGLLPFQPPSFLAVGVLAVILGFTMWLQFRLNPTPMDPVQKQVFALMPWMLMFVMAPFAAGLLVYWITNNVLTMAQQKYLYSKDPALRAAAEKEKADKAKAKAREASRTVEG